MPGEKEDRLFPTDFGETLALAAGATRMPVSAQKPFPNQHIEFHVAKGLPSSSVGPARPDKPLYETFRETAEKHGARIAVDDGSARLTYAQLLDASSRLASIIRAEVQAEGPIGILLPQENCSPIAILACLALGRCFVLLNKSDSIDYNARIIENAALAALLVPEHVIKEANPPTTLHRIDVSRAVVPGSAKENDAQHPVILIDDPMSILYTSGSTGNPKGIVHSQRSLLERIKQHITASHITEADVLMPLSPICALPGLRDCLSALLMGATLCIIDQKRAGLRETCRVMREAQVTICYAVPTLLRALMQADGDLSYFATLRIMRLGGERILWSDVQGLRPALPKTCQINITFSSTEVAVSGWFLPPEPIMDEPWVPVGYIVPGVDFAIIDDDGSPVPTGAVGELIVRSRGVALGYWENGHCVPGRIEVDSTDPTRRVVRTGDLVSITSSGLLRVIGRNDRQVKIRGQRVEPSELEAALRRSPDVADAAVAVRHEGTDPTLIAFIVATPTAGPELISALSTAVRSSLRSALYPAAFHRLDGLPRLSSGKLDNRALLEIDRERMSARASDLDAENHSDEERQNALVTVGRLWDHILGERSSTLGLTWDEVGGNSLQFLRLVFELEEALGPSLLPGSFTIDMNPAQLAAAIVAAPVDVGSYLSDRGLSQLFLFPGVGGDEPLLSTLRGDLQAQFPIITLQYPGWDRISDPQFGFSVMIAQLATQVSEAAPEGALHLVGYSYGGIVAFAVARQLQGEGRNVAFLGLLDTDISAPGSLRSQGISGFLARVRNLPSFFSRGDRHDNLARTLAHYLLAPSARQLSLRLLDPKLNWLGSGTRFSLDYWLCRFRRTDLARCWLDSLPKTDMEIRTFLFRSIERAAPESPDLGWRRFFPSLNIVAIPGDHFSMLTEHHRSDLVSELLKPLMDSSP